MTMHPTRFGYVYLTTNTINQKKYIGQHISSSFNEKYIGSGILLKEDVKVFGKSNFSIQILAWASNYEELNELEKDFIKKYEAVSSNEFYNIAEGGKSGGILLSEENIDQYNKWIGKLKNIKGNPEWRKEHSKRMTEAFSSPEHRKKMSVIQKNVQSTPEMREKKSILNKLAWKNKSSESRQEHAKNSARPGELNGRSIPITLFNKTYVSKAAAKLDLGIGKRKLKRLLQEQVQQ